MVEGLREVTNLKELTAAEVRLAAELKKYDLKYVEALYQYALRLENSGVPIIFDHEHLSRLSDFRVKFLYSVANGQEEFYHIFKIKKRTGGIRQICEPLPDLKILQRWLLDSLIVRMPVSKYAHAYRSGRSIKTSAKLHTGRARVVKIDLVDFFGSIKTDKITEVFERSGYSTPLSVLLSQLTCLGGSLPQGAPTSAALSNAIMRDFDELVGSWAFEHGWRYTRYADDLTFSGDGKVSDLFRFVFDQLNGLGMTINKAKTRVMGRGARQVVCGVVVNTMMGPSKKSLQEFRKELFFIEKYGLESHIERRGISKKNYLDSLIGRGKHLLWLSSHWPERCRKLSVMIDDLELLKTQKLNRTDASRSSRQLSIGSSRVVTPPKAAPS